MELFTIERYVGDLQSTENNANNESENLAQLLKQVRCRKRSRERQIHNISKSEDDLEGSSKLKKPKKKIKKNKIKYTVTDERSLEDENKERAKDVHPLGETMLSSDDSGYKPTKKKTKSNETLACSNNADKKVPSDKVLDEVQSNETVEEAFGARTSNNQTGMTVIGGENRKQEPNAVRRALPKWLSNPCFFSSDINKNLVALSEIKGLHSDLVEKLEKHGVHHLFPVQKLVIPAVLSSWEKQTPFGRGGFMPQDICVCAPTGSGKTLTYVLPVIELLKNNAMRRLEALVIVPTKDLATQVWNVFNIYVQGTGLRVGLANGLKSLQKEQKHLGTNSCLGYSSDVSILVATPGRLVEHISNTAGFSLQFLRFFIIDEADRLLAEPYFGWLDKVYASVFSSSDSKETYRSFMNTLTPFSTEKLQRPLQKLLFSATLTQNPEKLALLRLHKPKFFTVSSSENDEVNGETDLGTVLKTPATLEESMYICNDGGKPLVLLHLLTQQGICGVLCFTSSVESTHRLYLLVKQFDEIGVQEFSSSLSATRRQAILNDFKCGKTQIIICSDAMARGLDVPSVKYVISYDPPVSSKTYIHRVGRTARAGKTGNAITLLHDNEVFHFKKMWKSLNKGKISRYSVKNHLLEDLMERYESALEQLKTEVISSKKKRIRR